MLIIKYLKSKGKYSMTDIDSKNSLDISNGQLRKCLINEKHIIVDLVT